MDYKPRAILTLFLVFTCFILGLLSVWRRYARENPAFDSIPTTNPAASTEIGQEFREITILFLGVDRLRAPGADLKAIWVASYNLPEINIDLVGLSTDLPSYLEEFPTLEAAFQWTEEGDLDPDFLLSLQAYAPSPFSGIVVLDDGGFERLVDFLGGVDLSGQRLNGAAVLGALNLVAHDAETSLQMQVQVLEALSREATRIGRTPELTPLTDLIPDHAYTSIPFGSLGSMAIPLLPIHPDNLTISTITSPPPESP